MKKLISTNWMSLDGYIGGPGGEVDFVRGDDEMAAYELDLVGAADTLVLGRSTYGDFSGYWPKVPQMAGASAFEQSYAARVNALKKLVFSRTLQEPLWDETQFVREISREAVAPHKAGEGSMVMYGSASVAQQLARLGLIDEFHFVMHPLTLGGGVTLLGGLGERLQLERVAVREFGSGVVLMVYRPA